MGLLPEYGAEKTLEVWYEVTYQYTHPERKGVCTDRKKYRTQRQIDNAVRRIHEATLTREENDEFAQGGVLVAVLSTAKLRTTIADRIS